MIFPFFYFSANAVAGLPALTIGLLDHQLLAGRERCGRLSFGCGALDSALGGGVPMRGLTEIAGEAGAGKTQLCLQLALHAVLPEEHGGLGGK
jgi:RecA/RadA recombinase